MTIPYNTYTFHCLFTTEAVLPGYLGSTLRGSLGWALKKVSCALKRQQCATCMLREQCTYAWLFETEQYQSGNDHKVNARPHPFVIRPETTVAGKMKEGEELRFSLLLIGRANELLPHLIYAVKLMGESGIGSGRKYGMGRFILEKVTAGDDCVFNAEDEVVHQVNGLQQLRYDTLPEQHCEKLSMSLQTPLRIKQANKLTRQLPFHVVVRTALRRIAALEQAYGRGDPDLDFKGLVQRAEAIATDNSTIHWHELFRYSNRQKKKVSLSGIMGDIQYRGDLSEFFPLLQYVEKTNIGKQTVFGLGAFALSR